MELELSGKLSILAKFLGIYLEAEFNDEESVHGKISSPDDTPADFYYGPGGT